MFGLQSGQLLVDKLVDGFKDLNEIIWLLLEVSVLGKYANFVVDSLGPVLYLVIDDLYALKSLLQFGHVFVNCV